MGLKSGDLRDLVDDIVSVDAYASKMGKDDRVSVLSFQVKTISAAEDLCDFLEKGYKFILDADVSPGENHNGDYIVFVEIERDRRLHENIIKIVDDVIKLSGNEFKFRYYKQFRSYPLTLENIKKFVPCDPDNYGMVVKQDDNYKSFFKNSHLESIYMQDDQLVMKNGHNVMIFEFIEFGDALDVATTLTESYDILNTYPEILYLTKKIGDYNISKYGDKLVFENKTNLLVLKRVNV